MTQEEILRKYPLLKNSDFTIPRKTLFSLMDKDDLSDDRAHLIEYCNNAADNNDEPFFYDMLSAVEFILKDVTAFTTPDKRICLNYPCIDIVPMDKDRFRRWYFVFCHECMHQLWDTFAVGNRLKKELGSCDYELLNIASDCVINEYLKNNMPKGKTVPVSIILGETIKNMYGVDFDSSRDTQYSLYCKLLKLNKSVQNELKDKFGENEGQDQGQGQDNTNGKQGQGQDNTNGKQGGSSDDGVLTREEIEENRKHIDKIVNKYADRMGGTLADFIDKCKSSSKLEAGGLMLDADKGSIHWDKELMNKCSKYLKQRLLNEKKKYQSTFSRVKRGERAWSSGDLASGRALKKGKKVIKNKIGFNIGVYIDVSGSMQYNINKVFDTAYDIVNTLNKTFGKNEIVDPDKIGLKAYVFTEDMKEIKYGSKYRCSGGTYELDKLLKDIHDRNQDAFLNIIITDGEFSSYDKNECIKAIKDMDGLTVLVSNTDNRGIRDGFNDIVNTVNKKIGPKFSVIYTDPDFSI